MNVRPSKYYRYKLIPELEDRGEVEAAIAIREPIDAVDELREKAKLYDLRPPSDR